MNTRHEHVSVADLNRFFSGNLDVVQRGRVMSQCEECEECESTRREVFWLRTFARERVDTDCVLYGDCFSDETLQRHVEGKLTPNERALVDQHLRTCQCCRDFLGVISVEMQRTPGIREASADFSALQPGAARPVPSGRNDLLSRVRSLRETFGRKRADVVSQALCAAPAASPPSWELLGRLTIGGQVVEFLGLGESLFVGCSPDALLRVLVIDGEEHELKRTQRGPGVYRVEGLTRELIGKVLEDQKRDPQSHDCRIR